MWFDPVLNSSWRGKQDKEGKGQVQQRIDKERRKVRMGIRSTKTDLNMSSFLSHMAKLPLIKIRMAWPSSWSLFSMTTIMVLDHSQAPSAPSSPRQNLSLPNSKLLFGLPGDYHHHHYCVTNSDDNYHHHYCDNHHHHHCCVTIVNMGDQDLCARYSSGLQCDKSQVWQPIINNGRELKSRFSSFRRFFTGI